MNAHVLFVEDDSDLRELIMRSLQKAGYQVTEAANGTQAIELLTLTDDARPAFDVVLTDIVMGEIDGTEVMKVARSQPDPPEVILLTGNGTLQTAMESVRAGAFDYLLKPCLIPRLLTRISAAVERHRQVQAQAHTDEAVRQPETVLTPSAPGPDVVINGDSDPETGPGRYLTVGFLRVDTYRHEVWFDEQLLRVTPTEYEILACLATVPGRVVSYSDIAYHTHNTTMEASDAHDVLRHHIRNLRRKFDRRYLVGVRGVGYMLDAQSADDEIE
jgi:DNA-binding response OmpR family regulator